MGKLGVGLVALLVGLAAGAFGGITLGGGAMMGVGAGTGMVAGVCATTQAAQELGYLSPVQVDEVVRKAAAIASGKLELPKGAEVPALSNQCADALARLRAGSAK